MLNLNSNFEIRETILGLKEISAKKSSNSEEKGQEVEKMLWRANS